MKNLKHLSLALSFLAIVACTKPEATPAASSPLPVQQIAQCGKDTDCKGDRICQMGTCVNPSAAEVVPEATPARVKDAKAATSIDFHTAIGKTYADGRKILVAAGFQPSLNYDAQPDSEPPFNSEGFPEAGSCRSNCVTVFSSKDGKCWEVLTNFTDKITSNNEGVIEEISPSPDCG